MVNRRNHEGRVQVLPTFLDRIKELREGYESGKTPADATYSKLRDLEDEFGNYGDQRDEYEFYKIYSELELSCSEKVEAESRARLKNRG